jgi:hypothetical protein
MKKILNTNRFNALKHGVSSRQGLLPNENATDYAALEAQWRRELQPHGMVLEDRFASIVATGGNKKETTRQQRISLHAIPSDVPWQRRPATATGSRPPASFSAISMRN